MHRTAFLIGTVLWAGAALAQHMPTDRVVAAFSDPEQPGVLVVDAPQSVISVTGYAGAEVIAEARIRIEEKARSDSSRADGLRRLPDTATGLAIDEEENVMRVHIGRKKTELHLRVPFLTSLRLKSHNAGPIRVQGVRGDLEVANYSDDVVLTDIAGSAVVSTWNGDITITFAEIDPTKPMSFATHNRDIDVTFPPGWHANVRIKTRYGDVYTDFDIRLQEPPASNAGQTRADNTRYGTVNGGGPEIRFTTYSGDLFLRKAK